MQDAVHPADQPSTSREFANYGVRGMSASNDRTPEAGISISSKMDVLDESTAVLILLQNALDRAGFSMSSIHLNNAIETLRADRIRLREQFRV